MKKNMTCIVGLEDNGHVYIGGDSAGVDDDFGMETRLDRKVFKRHNMVIGFSGSFRIGQVLEHSLVIPEHPKDKSDMSYLVGDFVDAVRECCKIKGCIKQSSTTDTSEANFLMGYKSRLYTVHEDFQVGYNKAGYAAVGCGETYALGALFALHDSNVSPKDKIMCALRAAAFHNAGVAPPFYILDL
jgi:ATP-dependent protease HslVU (ClpYQ) peptidase subunit